MDKKIKMAEAFPPGEFLKEELEVRNWTQTDLANILGRQISVISDIVNGKRALSLDIAAELGEVFGTGLEYWMNLEQIYRAFLKTKEGSSGLAQRAKLYAKAPIGELKKRNWIEPSSDWDATEKSVCNLLHIGSLDDEPQVYPVAAKKATSYRCKPTPAQQAWFFRARELARAIQVAEFSIKAFEETIRRLKELLANPEDIRQVPRVIADGGIRFLIVENIAHSKIDGACFWLDAASPVIAMGIRYDRLDNFWYVLTHESGHVANQDGIKDEQPVIDVNLVGDETIPFEEKSQMEQNADLFAQRMLIDQDMLDNWIARTAPLYSKAKITAFARMNRIHPAIVLGQLQHRGEVHWSHSREMLVKIRHLITSSALTDGFGQTLPASA